MRTAKATGLTRQRLYKAFSETGNPSFANVLKVALGMGVRPIALPRRKAAKAKSRTRRKAA